MGLSDTHLRLRTTMFFLVQGNVNHFWSLFERCLLPAFRGVVGEICKRGNHRPVLNKKTLKVNSFFDEPQGLSWYAHLYRWTGFSYSDLFFIYTLWDKLISEVAKIKDSVLFLMGRFSELKDYILCGHSIRKGKVLGYSGWTKKDRVWRDSMSSW